MVSIVLLEARQVVALLESVRIRLDTRVLNLTIMKKILFTKNLPIEVSDFGELLALVQATNKCFYHLVEDNDPKTRLKAGTVIEKEYDTIYILGVVPELTIVNAVMLNL